MLLQPCEIVLRSDHFGYDVVIIDGLPNDDEKSEDESLEYATEIRQIVVESVNIRCMLNNVLRQEEIRSKHDIPFLFINPTFASIITHFAFSYPLVANPDRTFGYINKSKSLIISKRYKPRFLMFTFIDPQEDVIVLGRDLLRSVFV